MGEVDTGEVTLIAPVVVPPLPPPPFPVAVPTPLPTFPGVPSGTEHNVPVRVEPRRIST